MSAKQFGRYTMIEQLGRGAMGTVYRAHDPQIDRVVALKVIKLSDLPHAEQWRARFRREIRIAGSLLHPNIAVMFDAGEEDDSVYIVMELLEGETLADRMARGLTWREAIALLRPICEALDYAHRRGVIHRDVKPANIMVLPDGQVKLTDFGVARLETAPGITRPGMLVGTLLYMAPEQIRGEQVDGRADLFALGNILYEMLTGQNPFSGEGIEVLHQITAPTPVDLAPLEGRGPPALQAVVARALAKDPDERYATGAEMATALERCLTEAEETAAAVPTPSEPPPEHLRSPTPLPNPDLVLQLPPGVTLTTEEETLLRILFASYETVAVDVEYRSGYSGSRIFLILPIKADGRADAYIVVKIAPQALIRREWENFERFVKSTLPPVTTRLEEPPILPSENPLGALRYTFVGTVGAQRTESLRAYYASHTGAEVIQLLERRVFETFGHNWWLQRKPYTFRLREEYDRLLPVHLIISPDERREAGAKVISAHEGELATAELAAGDRVRLDGFIVEEIRPDRDDMTLTSGQPAWPFRVRVRPLPAGMETCRPGDPIAALEGVVSATRHDLFIAEVEKAFPGMEIPAPTITLAGQSYPNPLQVYPAMLEERIFGTMSTIHGDLNLENILVEPESGQAWLIDFATARDSHTLHDFMRLERDVFTRLLPEALAQAGLGLEAIGDLLLKLHTVSVAPTRPPPSPSQPELKKPFEMLAAIRRMAGRCLRDPARWDEYYRGLVLHLLGALKFANLDDLPQAPLPKQVAFAAAAWLIELPLPSPPPGGVIPRLLPFFRKPWGLVGSVALVGVLVFALYILWRQGIGPKPTGEPLALVAGVIGRVEVRRQDSDRVVPAVFGLELFFKDAVITYEDSAADILCHNGLLFSVEAERAITIRCQETGDVPTVGALDAETSSRIVRAVEEPRTITLARAGTRASPADVGQVPLLAFPRNTLIAAPRPTFRWTTVEGTTAYHLEVVNAISGTQWYTETAATELTYPTDAPALEPDVTYLVQVSAEPGAVQEKERAWFALLGDGARDELTTAVEAIRSGGVSSPTEHYLLGQLYSDYRLWGAAIDELEALTAGEPQASLYQQLGDLYFQTGLYPFAEDRYQAALDVATADGDRAGEATAHVGLGRVTDAYGQYAEAIAHLEKAEALYRELGDMERVETVAAALAEVQAKE